MHSASYRMPAYSLPSRVQGPLIRARETFGELAALPGLNLRGVAVHIGSQLMDLAPLEDAFAKVGALMADLRSDGHAITHVDLGGGLGVPYREGENPPSPAEYGAMVARATACLLYTSPSPRD